jgi:hypothetical protein
MSSISHEPPAGAPAENRWSMRSIVPEMWATISIVAIWIAVLFDAVYGPDLVSASNDGTYTRVPSVIIVAVFAYLATMVVAKFGYGRGRER